MIVFDARSHFCQAIRGLLIDTEDIENSALLAPLHPDTRYYDRPSQFLYMLQEFTNPGISNTVPHPSI